MGVEALDTIHVNSRIRRPGAKPTLDRTADGFTGRPRHPYRDSTYRIINAAFTPTAADTRATRNASGHDIQYRCRTRFPDGKMFDIPHLASRAQTCWRV